MITLNEIVASVNANWTPNYKAEIKDNAAVISYENAQSGEFEECSRVSNKLEVTGTDEDAIDQLNWLIRN